MFPTCSEILEVLRGLGYARSSECVRLMTEPAPDSLARGHARRSNAHLGAIVTAVRSCALGDEWSPEGVYSPAAALFIEPPEAAPRLGCEIELVGDGSIGSAPELSSLRFRSIADH